MQYYSAMKKNETLPLAATWMDLENILNEMSDREIQILYDITYVWNPKKNNRNESIYKTETDIENKLMVTKGEKEGGKDKLGVWD